MCIYISLKVLLRCTKIHFRSEQLFQRQTPLQLSVLINKMQTINISIIKYNKY